MNSFHQTNHSSTTLDKFIAEKYHWEGTGRQLDCGGGEGGGGGRESEKEKGGANIYGKMSVHLFSSYINMMKRSFLSVIL